LPTRATIGFSRKVLLQGVNGNIQYRNMNIIWRQKKKKKKKKKKNRNGRNKNWMHAVGQQKIR